MRHLSRSHIVLIPLLILFSVFASGMLAGCKSSGPALAQPTATKSQVVITIQNTRYGVSDPLGILIKNAGEKDVYALDGQASCTMLQLQQYNTQQKTWAKVDRCTDKSSPHVLVIHAGMSEPFTLSPGSSSDPNTWETGLYRVALSFSASPDGMSDAQIAYSDGFTIKGS